MPFFRHAFTLLLLLMMLRYFYARRRCLRVTCAIRRYRHHFATLIDADFRRCYAERFRRYFDIADDAFTTNAAASRRAAGERSQICASPRCRHMPITMILSDDLMPRYAISFMLLMPRRYACLLLY